jgi:iron complex transport system permease protein
MQIAIKHKIYFLVLLILLLISFVLNFSLGSVAIPFKEVFHALTNGDLSDESWRYIILSYRIPKALTAILAGIGLSVSGLLMQTLFRNPLAGPYVLGISSGASLGVAILVLGSAALGFEASTLSSSSWSLIMASSLGSLAVLFTVLILAKRMQNTMSILIIGLMFGSLTSALVSILAFFSSAEQLQQFIFWSFGSLGNRSWNEIGILSVFVAIGLILILFILKDMNSLLLGENYATSLGVSIKKTRLILIIATSLLAGSITAFVGPIAFIGLAVPHISRILFKSSQQQIILLASLLIGATIMLIADTIAQLPTSEYALPISAITTLFGAPIVIFLLLKYKNISI